MNQFTKVDMNTSSEVTSAGREQPMSEQGELEDRVGGSAFHRRERAESAGRNDGQRYYVGFGPAVSSSERQREYQRGYGHEQRERACEVETSARAAHLWDSEEERRERDCQQAQGDAAQKYGAPSEGVHQRAAAERAGYHAQRSERGHYAERASPELGRKQACDYGGAERYQQRVSDGLEHAQPEHQRQAVRQPDGQNRRRVGHEAEQEHSLQAEGVRRSPKPELHPGAGSDVEDDYPLDSDRVGGEAVGDVGKRDVDRYVQRGQKDAGRRRDQSRPPDPR